MSYIDKGVDQVKRVIDLIKKDPMSRRILLSAWNPEAQSDMALPPCHVSYQFYVDCSNRLHCQMYQRSADAFLGLPFNIASTALLTHLIANETDKKLGTIRLVIGDLHLYEEHVGVALTQTKREIYDFPTINIDRKPDELWGVQADEIVLKGYKYHGTLKAKMAV